MGKYDRETLEREIFQYSQTELARRYGTSQCHMGRVLKRLGIKTPTVAARNNLIEVTEEMKDVIIGSLLGDGHLSWTVSTEAYYRAEQGEKQREYLFWKYDILKSLCKTEPKQSIRESPSWYFQTKTHQFFSQLHKMFYPESIKVVPSNLAGILTKRSLAVWFMDDGTCDSKNARGELTVQGYTLDGIKLVQNVLREKFALETVIRTRFDKKLQRHVNNLAFNKKQFLKLTQIIKPYIIPSMEYKLGNTLATTMCPTPNE